MSRVDARITERGWGHITVRARVFSCLTSRCDLPPRLPGMTVHPSEQITTETPAERRMNLVFTFALIATVIMLWVHFR